MLNNVIKQFLIYHGINPDYLSKLVDTNVYHTPQYLGVISGVIIFRPQVITEVSIGDIYGTNINNSRGAESIFDLLCEFYKDEPKPKRSFFKRSDEHHIRSNDNLLLNRDAMLEKCNASPELMSVCRIDNANNINLIYSNGMHRYLALRTLYLKEISNNPNDIERIKKKYKVKVGLNEIDEIKTFCFFIFRHYQRKNGKRAGYRLEYVNREYTGRLLFATLGENNKVEEEFAFNDEELIEFIKPFIELDLDYYKSIKVPSFQLFLTSLGYNEDSKIKL